MGNARMASAGLGTCPHPGTSKAATNRSVPGSSDPVPSHPAWSHPGPWEKRASCNVGVRFLVPDILRPLHLGQRRRSSALLPELVSGGLSWTDTTGRKSLLAAARQSREQTPRAWRGAQRNTAAQSVSSGEQGQHQDALATPGDLGDL